MVIREHEIWARRTIEATLCLPVRHSDHNTGTSVHDLEIVRPDRVDAAEVTASADGKGIALWKLVRGREDRWIDTRLQGGWAIQLARRARGKRVLAELPDLLLDLESAGVDLVEANILDDEFANPLVRAFALRMREIGVARVNQLGTNFPGSIYVMPGRAVCLVVPHTSDAVAEWITAFVRDERNTDNRAKLANSGADERHLFVVVPFPFNDTTDEVEYILMSDESVLPELPPDLPREVTHVWIMNNLDGGSGFRWSPDEGWQRFKKQFDEPYS